MLSTHQLATEMYRERLGHAERRRHARRLLADRRAAWRTAWSGRYGRKATSKALRPRPETRI